MFRKDLIELLVGNPMSVAEIAMLTRESPKQIVDDLRHVLRSLKHADYRAVVEPGRCRACGFEFSSDKLTKPSKCPDCHSTWIEDPRVRTEAKGPRKTKTPE